MSTTDLPTLPQKYIQCDINIIFHWNLMNEMYNEMLKNKENFKTSFLLKWMIETQFYHNDYCFGTLGYCFSSKKRKAELKKLGKDVTEMFDDFLKKNCQYSWDEIDDSV